MDRLIATNSVPFASADTAPATGTPQYATTGNPATSTPPTVFPAYAWNMLQDEIYNVIIAAGLTPNRNAWNQLLTAIQSMLQGSTTNVGVDTGTANAYVVAFTPALTAPIPWVPFWIKVAHANTGASTLNATGTVEPLVGGAHLALQGGEMVANGNALIYWNPTLAAGAGSYVLLFCSGAPEQIAPASAPEHAAQMQQMIGVVGSVRNLKASLNAAGTSLTLTADEVGVKSALGGPAQMLANFNQTVSTTVSGIGGVVGTALAASGFAGVYAAWNPTTQTQGAFIVNANSLAPNVAVSPPAGWVSTGLISVWPLNASTQFIAAFQNDRRIRFAAVYFLSSSSTPASPTSLALTAIPVNAKKVRGYFAFQSTTTTSSITCAISATNPFMDVISIQGIGQSGFPFEIDLQTAQTVYWQAANAAGTFGVNALITGYEI